MQSLGGESAYRGRLVEVRVERFRHADGEAVSREVVRHRGAVGIVAHDDEVVWLVCQPREAVGEERLLEIPAGRLDIDGEGRLRRDQYAAAMAKKPRLVAITHTSNGLGVITPAKELIAEAHAAGGVTHAGPPPGRLHPPRHRPIRLDDQERALRSERYDAPSEGPDACSRTGELTGADADQGPILDEPRRRSVGRLGRRYRRRGRLTERADQGPILDEPRRRRVGRIGRRYGRLTDGEEYEQERRDRHRGRPPQPKGHRP